ncbi:ML domain protein (macronuclear) [Tetrahymena thermophila SB210]|uniref:ML domain protein n=1 Tax=Tetrahymena thermophila (strain SB210) TaxID=312017 RepID=Q22YA3_TETTS|nr:ML domain protein [Tetrahymena thermophila SB210]EAR90121.1 ML domain protein [Tetrahymena thermophila SB210]|eukprot:XP_001010366.1 ML domain protein [Tetrahymena thermophila SB210]
MTDFKLVLVVTALALVTICGVYQVQNAKTTSYPLDDQGRKIRLGGIPWNFTNCGSENDALIITSIVFSAQPERAAPPNDATLTGTYMVHTDIKALNVVVKLSGVQVFNNNLAATGTYDPGDMFTFPYTFQIPGIAPGGAYTLDLKFLNKAGNQISCTQISMDL